MHCALPGIGHQHRYNVRHYNTDMGATLHFRTAWGPKSERKARSKDVSLFNECDNANDMRISQVGLPVYHVRVAIYLCVHVYIYIILRCAAWSLGPGGQ